MSRYTTCETLISVAADSTALTASTTPTTILHPTALVGLPLNYFRVESILRITAWGRITTVVTTPGTLQLDVRLGAINVFSSGLMTLNVVAKVNVGWKLQVEMTCRTIGSGTAAAFFGQGLWTSEAVIGNPVPTAGGSASHVLPYNAAPAVGAGFDSTAAQTLNLFGTWSLNNANSIQTHQYMVESMN